MRRLAGADAQAGEMSNNSFDVASRAAISDRRRLPRQEVSFAYVELGEGNGGTLLNLSESGLAVQTLLPLFDGVMKRMRFQFSHSNTWIDAHGRIAWTSELNRVAGIRFVGLTPAARVQIREWICSESVLREPRQESSRFPADLHLEALLASESSVAERELSASVLVKTKGHSVRAEGGSGILPDSTRTPYVGAPPKENALGSLPEVAENSRKRVWAMTAGGVALIFVLLWFGGHKVSRRIGELISGTSPATTHTAQTSLRQPAMAKPSQPVSTKTPAARPAARLSSSSPYASAGTTSGFALQVAAFVHRENADALAESLRGQDFPVFLSRGSTDRLYKILVGPYADLDSAIHAQSELKKQNFEVIRLKWNPHD